VFVVEGARAVRQLVGSRWTVRSVLLASNRVEALADVIGTAGQLRAPVYVAPADVLHGIAGFPVHRGVLALGARQADPDLSELLPTVDSALVVEAVNDHENLGALFRNAAAFGVGTVLLDPTSCDPLYRRAIRVSVGHVLRVPFTRIRPWPGQLEAVRRAGLTVVALSPDAATGIDELPRLRRVALMVGAEGSGLTSDAIAVADVAARIPMASGVDSLNVATAAAIALHRLLAHHLT
jgi:tRNA G18 (ribose-2'-O)-methylase SpoU